VHAVGNTTQDVFNLAGAEVGIELVEWSFLQLKAVAERLTRIGVKAVVAKNRPPNSTLANWRDVKVSDSERFSILLLLEPLPKGPPK